MPMSASCSSARSRPKRRRARSRQPPDAAATRRRSRCTLPPRRPPDRVPAATVARARRADSPRRRHCPRGAGARGPQRSGWPSCRSGLRKTGSSIAQAFVGAEIDDEMYEDLEAALLQADAGVAATRHLLDDLQRADQARPSCDDPAAVRGAARRLHRRSAGSRSSGRSMIGEHTPTVIMVVGVNGAGKTTSIGKLTRHLRRRRPEGAARRRRHVSRRRARAAARLGRARRAAREHATRRAGSRSSARKAAIRPA